MPPRNQGATAYGGRGDGRVETVQEFMTTLGLLPDALRHAQRNWAEVAVQIITRSPVPVLLLVVGLLALWYEFLEPGILITRKIHIGVG